MLCHGSLLLTVAVSLASGFPQLFGLPNLPVNPGLSIPSLPAVNAEIPGVTGGGILTGLLRFLGLLSSPISNVKDIIPLPGNDISVPGLSVPELGIPSVGGSGNQQDLQRRISRLEAVLKLAGKIQIVGDKIIATSGKEVDFATSNSICKDVGGRIVTPMNEAENAAVLELVKNSNRYTYLGFKEGLVPGKFNDMNGVPVVYTHWRKGEPSGKGTENCVEMYTDGQWNDKACNQIRLTICEL